MGHNFTEVTGQFSMIAPPEPSLNQVAIPAAPASQNVSTLEQRLPRLRKEFGHGMERRLRQEVASEKDRGNNYWHLQRGHIRSSSNL